MKLYTLRRASQVVKWIRQNLQQECSSAGPEAPSASLFPWDQWILLLVCLFVSKLDSKIHSFNTSLQFLAYISCGSLSTKSARRVPDFWVVTSTLVLVLQLKTQKHHLAEMRWAEVCDDLSTESPVLLFWWKIGFLSSNQKKNPSATLSTCNSWPSWGHQQLCQMNIHRTMFSAFVFSLVWWW